MIGAALGSSPKLRSISSSVLPSPRSQSVRPGRAGGFFRLTTRWALRAGAVRRALFGMCLPRRNEAKRIASDGPYESHDSAVEDSDADAADLAVVLAAVERHQHGRFEHHRTIDKVD